MSDIDYGCNANDPEGIIAVILDNAQTAAKIISELDALGFAIISKEPTRTPTEDEAGEKCHPSFDQTGEANCPGQFDKDGNNIVPSKEYLAALDRWIDEQQRNDTCFFCDISHTIGDRRPACRWDQVKAQAANASSTSKKE